VRAVFLTEENRAAHNAEGNPQQEARHTLRILTVGGHQSLLAQKLLTLHCAMPEASLPGRRSGGFRWCSWGHGPGADRSL